MAQQSIALSKTQRLQRLLEISRNLSSTLDQVVLLEKIVEVAKELTQSEAASILLFDRDQKQLYFASAPGLYQADLKQLRVPLRDSAAGWIFSNGRPLVIQNAAQDRRIYRKVDQKLGFQTNSLLGVPLLFVGEPIGVLEAVNKLEQAHYTEDDLDALETLAGQAAIAIKNAQLMGDLQDMNAELKRLDRMKSDFIAIASHELRTPLGLILGHATYLKELVGNRFAEQMDVIVRSAMRLKEIIEDLATIAHSEQGQSVVRRQRFSMAQMIEETAETFQREAKAKKIVLDFDVDAGNALMVDGDRDKIQTALSNMVENALVFTDAGGQVGIKAETDGETVSVFVVDTGIGIPADEVGRVFERFYQVEGHLTRRHGGMGLGLSIAKSMVEMHGGRIFCESKEGTGSLFWFTIPVEATGPKTGPFVVPVT